jgi:hypothetical protein
MGPPGRSAEVVFSDFYMELSSPSVNMSGDYTLTFTADRACTQLPLAARTRTYQAAIREWFRPNIYLARLSGASFFEGGNYIVVGVAGSVARFVQDPFDDFSGGIVEELAPSTSLQIYGVYGEAEASVGASSTSAFLRGTFTYCADAIPSNRPPHRCAVPEVTCYSSNHGLVLTRR